MREIKFRGKCAKSGKWTTGDLIHGVGWKKGNIYILPNEVNLAYVDNCDPLDGVQVSPETVGQYTGLKDKNGVEIYDGDVVELNENYYDVQDPDNISHHHIYWDNTCGKFWDTRLQDGDSLSGYLDGDISFVLAGFVVGNAQDNPELFP